MKKAVVVDKDYGSVTHDDLRKLKDKFKEAGIDLKLEHYNTEDEIIAGVADADAILGTGNPPITQKVLDSAPNLKLVQRFGIGVNSIDLEAASANNKAILNMPGFCIEELAAHATSFILSLTRNTSYYDRKIRQGEWPKAQYFTPKSIPEMTIGLYGFGGSAQELYKIFRHGFDSRVITCDPFFPVELQKKFDVEFVDFDELLKQSDVISVHAPLNDDTKHMFSYEAFEKMKSDAMIINIARGPLIDEVALVDALEKGKIRFAGLDVFENEPLNANSALKSMDNVLLTSHSAFYGEGSKSKQLGWAFELVNDALNNNMIDKKFVANKDIIDKNTDFIFK